MIIEEKTRALKTYFTPNPLRGIAVKLRLEYVKGMCEKSFPSF